MGRRRPLLEHRIHHAGGDAGWLVLVHGAGVSSEIWDGQVGALGREYNLLLPELRGHGGHARPDDGAASAPYTWESVSQDVLDLMDHHGIEQAHLLGVSMGTIVVRTMAELAPDRVRSMVMAGAVARLEPFARVLIALARRLQHVLPYLWLYAINAWIVMPRRSHRESRREVVRQARQLGQIQFRRWFRLTRPLPALLHRYAARDPEIPTLYVSGDQDHLFLPGVRAVSDAHASAGLHVFEDCGHVCTIERAEAFNRLALEFVRKQESVDASGFVPGSG